MGPGTTLPCRNVLGRFFKGSVSEGLSAFLRFPSPEGTRIGRWALSKGASPGIAPLRRNETFGTPIGGVCQRPSLASFGKQGIGHRKTPGTTACPTSTRSPGGHPALRIKEDSGSPGTTKHLKGSCQDPCRFREPPPGGYPAILRVVRSFGS
jgi:hypothetical protein